mgnify:CR=1 FL=1
MTLHLIKMGWFGEKEVMWPGQQMRLRVADDGVLLRQRTEFQDLLVFQSTDYGRCLVLDGVIQLTETVQRSPGAVNDPAQQALAQGADELLQRGELDALPPPAVTWARGEGVPPPAVRA